MVARSGVRAHVALHVRLGGTLVAAVLAAKAQVLLVDVSLYITENISLCEDTKHEISAYEASVAQVAREWVRARLF